MVVLVSLQMVELTHTDLNIITRSVYFILYILEVYLTICPSLAYSDFLSPVRLLPLSLLSLLPCVSLLLIILSLSAHGVLALHPLPHSLSLSLSGTADGDYGPVLSFVLGPQRDLWLFGQHAAQLPISHTKCKCLSFH